MMPAMPVRFDLDGGGVILRRPTPMPVLRVTPKAVIAVETPAMMPPSPKPVSGDGITDGASGLGTFLSNLFYPSGEGGPAPQSPTSGGRSAISGIILIGLLAAGIYWFMKG